MAITLTNPFKKVQISLSERNGTYQVMLPNIYMALSIHVALSVIFLNAVLKYGFSPYLLYLSDAVVVQPQATIFIPLVYAGAIYNIYVSIWRYVIVREYNFYANHYLSTANLYTIIASILSNVTAAATMAVYKIDEEPNFVYHGCLAFVSLTSFTCYGFGQIWIDFMIGSHWRNMSSCKLRLIIMTIYQIFATISGMCVCLTLHIYSYILQQHWMRKVVIESDINADIYLFGVKFDGYKILSIASASEWICAASLFGFYSTYVKEFSRTKIFIGILEHNSSSDEKKVM